MNIHQVLEQTIKSWSMPGPETPLSDIRQLSASILIALQETEKLKQTLSALAGKSARRQGSPLNNHAMAAYRYLTQVGSVCAGIQDALSSLTPEKVTAAFQAREGLEQQAAPLNVATEELARKYGL